MTTKVLASLALLAVAVAAFACEAETGPDAPKRQNGCIDLTCAPGGGPDAAVPVSDGG